MLRFACPHCQAVLRVAEEKAGSPVACPHCKRHLRAPSFQTERPTTSVPADEPPDDEPEETGRDRPRRRRQRRQLAGGPFRVVALVVGGLLTMVLGIVGCCAAFMGLAEKFGGNVANVSRADPPLQTVTAAQLVQEFQADEAAANAKYRGAMVEVTGAFLQTGRDPDGTRYVQLQGGAGGVLVHCLFPDEDPDEMATFNGLRKGQQVTIEGECAGKSGHVRLTDCVLIDP